MALDIRQFDGGLDIESVDIISNLSVTSFMMPVQYNFAKLSQEAEIDKNPINLV